MKGKTLSSCIMGNVGFNVWALLGNKSQGMSASSILTIPFFCCCLSLVLQQHWRAIPNLWRAPLKFKIYYHFNPSSFAHVYCIQIRILPVNLYGKIPRKSVWGVSFIWLISRQEVLICNEMQGRGGGGNEIRLATMSVLWDLGFSS